MKVTLWGTRGSIAAPGPETVRYGGNTACVGVESSNGSLLVLDAGTGLRRLGAATAGSSRRIDILLTHLHLDHVQGLGFFGPLYEKGMEVHFWGPPSTTHHLQARLSRYLSPPLFPVRLRDMSSRIIYHDVPFESFRIGDFEVRAELVCHPGATVGYRISENGRSLAYLPDHEPALGVRSFPLVAGWTSGFDLAADVDLLLHDCQYFAREYETHAGWGHSTIEHAASFATLCRAGRLVSFHHDPGHGDDLLDESVAATRATHPGLEIVPGREGAVIEP